MKLLKNSLGMSISELMVGLGIASASAAISTQVYSSLSKANKNIDSKVSNSALNQTIQLFLANENQCTLAIQNNKITQLDESTVVLNIAGIGILKEGEKNPTFNSTVTALKLKNLVQIEQNPLGLKIYAGQLYVAYSNDLGEGNQLQRKGASLGSLSVMLDQQNNILKCNMGSLEFVKVTENKIDNTKYPNKPPANTNTTTDGSNTNASTDGTKPPLCSSIEECAVYDYFMRNEVPDSIASAKRWMESNSNWKSIASAYVGSMTTLAKLNFLGNATSQGLTQTGRDWKGTGRKDTLDTWVAEAVANDPSGSSMLTTESGLTTLKQLFTTSDGSADSAQQVLRATLSKSPSLMMDSGLGIGIWQKALGYVSANEMVKEQPEATIKAVTGNNDTATTDSAAVLAVIDYMKNNPQESVKIAEGTGIWGKNLKNGVADVVNYISTKAKEDGNNETAIAVAKATSTWAGVIGSERVGNAIASDSQEAYKIATGTAAAEKIFSTEEVKTYIANDSGKAAQGALAIESAKSSGATDAEIKAYIQANPDTWQNWRAPSGK